MDVKFVPTARQNPLWSRHFSAAVTGLAVWPGVGVRTSEAAFHYVLRFPRDQPTLITSLDILRIVFATIAKTVVLGSSERYVSSL